MNPFLFLFALLSLLLSSCENTTHNNKTVMKNDEFEWQETLSCPPGYAIDVFAGGLSSKRGFTSLFLGTYTGEDGWGAGSSGMTYGVKTLPNHLHLIWVSHFEHKFYEVDTPIDYQKMVDLFNEGYYLASDDRDNPDPYWQNYDSMSCPWWGSSSVDSGTGQANRNRALPREGNYLYARGDRCPTARSSKKYA